MKQRIEDIEVLRGIAVLAIMAHHAYHNLLPWSTPLLDRLYSYFSGTGSVDLFFAISGFVITRNIQPRISQCADSRSFVITAIAFWIRRVWRLLPSAWICLGFILIAPLAFNSSGAFGTFRANFAGVVAALLQVENLHFANNFPVSDLGLGATFHFWTLSLEEQFYMLLPFAIFFSGRWFGWIVAAVLAVQFFSVRPSVYYWMFRTDAMMFGILIALWSQQPSYKFFEPFFLRSSRIARAGFLWGLVTAITVVGAQSLRMTEYMVSIFAVLAALLVLAASYNGNYLMAPGIPKRLLMWTGTRSYGLYLWHVPMFFATREIWARYARASGISINADLTGAFCLTAATLLIAIAELNYRFVEMPLRDHGAAVARRWEQNAKTSASQVSA